MAVVVVPALLRKLTGGVERVTVSGRNVRQVIDDLERQFPGFKEQLVQGDEMKPSIAVSIDGEMGTGGLLDRVKETSEIFFIPAIGGGTPSVILSEVSNANAVEGSRTASRK